MTTQTVSGSQPPTRQAGSLRRDALSVLGAVAMAMAFMGPATSVAFNTQPAAGGAGYALPFAILLALVACLLVANTIASFARKLPTAGFVYTFNTRGLGADGGFMSGWLLLLGYGMVGPMLFAAFGYFTSNFLQTQFNINVPWGLITVLIVGIVWGINALGISRSAKVALIFLSLEVGVMLSLFSTILAKGGAQGLSFAPFNPMNSRGGISGLGIGMLWGVLMFIGFESAGTLGEEAREPRRTVPIALFAAVGIIGVFYVLGGYAAAIGYGQGHVSTFTADGNPLVTLGSRYWGVTWIVVITVLNSQFANLISGCSAFVRVLFSMGREGILPRTLGTTGRGHVPQFALAAYMVFSLAYALGVGLLFGPLGVYGFAGTILGLAMVLCYIAMCIAVIRFYRRDYPDEFSMVRHGVFPVLGALLMLLPVWGLVWPVPAYPINLVPWITLGWLIVGGVYLWVIHRYRHHLLGAMGRVFEGDTADTSTTAERIAAAASVKPA
jgi:amino acid transporter